MTPAILDWRARAAELPADEAGGAHSGSLEQAFDAIAALLSATSYTRRFAWDIEESFAHVPFPAAHADFAEAASIGAQIRALETFLRKPADTHRTATMEGRATGLTLDSPGPFQKDGRGGGSIGLQENQSLRLVGVPVRVWEFWVSGYRVPRRWLEARRGEALDAALLREILDVAWRIEELLYWFDTADLMLHRALAALLTRAVLGMGGGGNSRTPALDLGA